MGRQTCAASNLRNLNLLAFIVREISTFIRTDGHLIMTLRVTGSTKGSISRKANIHLFFKDQPIG
ncbi:uncharacterized protein LOC6620529 isoform X3 [Drosophila sechellia]|uniref:uncharacterized protein LOC6620529 isoform X3 n=1 Tax=Drosophila sechellia TaxID=7238 RepID=UPI0013DE23FE|nr:uncharacterized protein LOC6620529 isoform X3 [Drosophila sechellia]